MSNADRHFSADHDTKYYLIFLHPMPERPLTPEVVDQHAAHLAELDDSGKLVMAGTIAERRSGLIVVRSESAAEVMAIAEEDPLVRGAYRTYELGTWLVSDRQNNYHPNVHTAARK